MNPWFSDMLICFVVMVVFLMVLAYQKIEYREKPLFLLGVVAFALSMIGVFILTGISLLSGFHTDINWYGIQLIPFRGIGQVVGSNITHALMNILGNIVLLMPLGLLLPLLWPKCRKWYVVLMWGLSVSLFIEVSQLFTLRGTDVDDLLLNSVGALCGYFLWLLLYRKFSALCCKFSTPEMSSKDDYLLAILCVLIPFIIRIGVSCYYYMIYFK